LQGGGRYLDDLVFPKMLSVSFARSPHAHARIDRIETAGARAVPGVAGVVTAAELRAVAKPLAPRLDGGGFTQTAWPALADGTAQFCGEAVAAVVASASWPTGTATR
jgi:CO/xanthine dehydrogenase Mo-binding subunit